ncbi:MAG: hypothetical protein ACLR4Z_15195 [Butyricicoccaceae bacterium]
MTAFALAEHSARRAISRRRSALLEEYYNAGRDLAAAFDPDARPDTRRAAGQDQARPMFPR